MLHTESILKARKIVKTGLYCLLGILVVVFRHTMVENLKFLIAPLLILYGSDAIFLHIAERKGLHEANEFFYGAVQVLLGLVILSAFDNTVESTHYIIICVVWATWALLREASELEEAFHKLLRKNYIALLNVAESAVNIAFSISLLIEPGEHHALIHCWLLSVELITAVLFPILEERFAKNMEQKQNNTTDEAK